MIYSQCVGPTYSTGQYFSIPIPDRCIYPVI